MVAFFSGVGRHAGVSHNPGGDGVDGGGVAFGQFEAFSELFVVVVDAGYVVELIVGVAKLLGLESRQLVVVPQILVVVGVVRHNALAFHLAAEMLNFNGLGIGARAANIGRSQAHSVVAIGSESKRGRSLCGSVFFGTGHFPLIFGGILRQVSQFDGSVVKHRYLTIHNVVPSVVHSELCDGALHLAISQYHKVINSHISAVAHFGGEVECEAILIGGGGGEVDAYRSPNRVDFFLVCLHFGLMFGILLSAGREHQCIHTLNIV